MNFEIKSAENDLDLVRNLFTEYAQSLDVDLCFQDFKLELALLPGKYAAPEGRLYLAYCDHQLAGCIALRPYDLHRSELKRLFIRTEFRGLGLGKLLINQIIKDAKEIGYHSILLDTLNTMKPAIRAYQSLGFAEIEPYYNNPLAGATYFSLDLTITKENLCEEKIEK